MLLLFGPVATVIPGLLVYAIVDHYLGPFGTRHAW